MLAAGTVARRLVRSTTLQVIGLYGLIALGLLSPMASNTIVPSALDHMNTVRLIIQAKMALDEGQFPLRVTPWQDDGRRYPLYQFYAPLPYTVAGALYKWVIPSNPFLVYKLMLWAALVSGGLFARRIVRWLMNSPPIGIVAGVLYMASPYFLVNIHARGAFAESMGQGLIPAVVYASLRCFAKGNIRRLAAAGVIWSALAMTHPISFVYTSLFGGLLIFGLALPRLARPKTWRRLSWTGAAYGVGLLLAIYHLAPIISASDYLPVSYPPNPGVCNWLTPISCLLSPAAVSPEPLPGQSGTPYLYASVGLPGVAAVVVCFFGLLNGSSLMASKRLRWMMVLLLALFLLAFFMAWSPVDFWSMLPRPLRICQVSFRIVAQAMWTSAILAGFALKMLWGPCFNRRHAVVAVLLVLIANGSFLPPLKQSDLTLAEICATPDMGYGHGSYIPGNVFAINRWAVNPDKLIRCEAIQQFFKQRGATKQGELLIKDAGETYVQLPILFYPSLFDVRVDGIPAAYYMNQGLAVVKLNQGKHDVSVTFVGLPWANRVCAAAWIALALLVLASFRRGTVPIFVSAKMGLSPLGRRGQWRV